jgi:hypothetical protein
MLSVSFPRWEELSFTREDWFGQMVNRVFHDLLRPFAFAVIISFEFSVR